MSKFPARASFLPPFPFPPPVFSPRSIDPPSYRCTAHTRPLFIRKKKKNLQLSFHAPHGSLRFFFSFATDSPISPSRFSPVSESWIRTPSVHDGPRVQRPANMTGVSPIRVTNSPLFFLVRARARVLFSHFSFSCLFLSFPSCSCVGPPVVHHTQCGEKKFH